MQWYFIHRKQGLYQKNKPARLLAGHGLVYEQTKFHMRICAKNSILCTKVKRLKGFSKVCKKEKGTTFSYLTFFIAPPVALLFLMTGSSARFATVI